MNSTLNTTDNGSRCGVAFKRQLSVCRVLLVGLAGTTDLWRGKTLRVRIRRRSTCLRREPTATRGRSSLMARARHCPMSCLRRLRSHQTERNQGDG
jgi:hypothetical protein